MRDPEREEHVEVPESIQRKLALYAEGTTRAIVVGNRNGIIEWANRAWTRVTGCALDELLHKPVVDFLRDIDLDPNLVRFVHECFTAGQVCQVEVPFAAPDGRSLRIDLRVEPLFDSRGEVRDFIAIASDASERIPTGSDPTAGDSEPLPCADLGALARRLCHEIRPQLGARTQLEAEIELGLPEVTADAEVLWRWVERLGRRAVAGLASDWGTVTVGTGLLGHGPGPIHHGELGLGAGSRLHAYLEVHDTGPELGPATCVGASEPFRPSPGADRTSEPDGTFSLARAREVIGRFGGRVFAETAPWCGTSVLIVLPVAAAAAATAAAGSGSR